MAISLDGYRVTGKRTERVVVVDNEYLNKRIVRWCPCCEEEEFGSEEFDREYTNYISTCLWNDRYTDWSDGYTWEIAEDDIPF